jgi:hypothetical protein
MLNQDAGKKSILLKIIVLLLATIAAPVFGGTVLKYQGLYRDSPFSTTLMLQGPNARLESSYNGNLMAAVYNGEQRQLFLLDLQNGTYVQYSEQEIVERNEPLDGDLSEEVDETSSSMESSLYLGQPGQQDDMEVHYSEPKEILEESEISLQITANGMEVKTLKCWPSTRVEEDYEDVGCLIRWADLKPVQRLQALLSKAGTTDPDHDRPESIAEYPGLPAHLAILNQDGTPATEEKLMAVYHEAIPESAFLIPQDFKLDRRR